MQVGKQVNNFQLNYFFILCESVVLADALYHNFKTLDVFNKLKLLLLSWFWSLIAGADILLEMFGLLDSEPFAYFMEVGVMVETFDAQEVQILADEVEVDANSAGNLPKFFDLKLSKFVHAFHFLTPCFTLVEPQQIVINNHLHHDLEEQQLDFFLLPQANVSFRRVHE